MVSIEEVAIPKRGYCAVVGLCVSRDAAGIKRKLNPNACFLQRFSRISDLSPLPSTMGLSAWNTHAFLMLQARKKKTRTRRTLRELESILLPPGSPCFSCIERLAQVAASMQTDWEPALSGNTPSACMKPQALHHSYKRWTLGRKASTRDQTFIYIQLLRVHSSARLLLRATRVFLSVLD